MVVHHSFKLGPGASFIQAWARASLHCPPSPPLIVLRHRSASRSTVAHIAMSSAWARVICMCHAGQFQNSFPELFDMVDYSITDTKEAGGVHTVIAEVQTSKSKDKQPVRFRFELAQKDIGKKKGSLMTKQLLKES